jgi:protein-S-isoprenylcysteine O-methyltransferase Ste14
VKSIPIFTQKLEQLRECLNSFDGVARVIVLLCAFATFAAIVINFLAAKKANTVRTETRSLVETGSMLGFFCVFYCLIRFQIGTVSVSEKFISLPLACLGLSLVIGGTCVNVLGRFALGGNWGNQIRIYNNHQLVTGGAYRYVRHPLYASLIWMFCGAGLFFHNWLALAVNLCVFVPAMYYRGRQEEQALTSRFPEYVAYAGRTGMFFPKL